MLVLKEEKRTVASQGEKIKRIMTKFKKSFSLDRRIPLLCFDRKKERNKESVKERMKERNKE